MGKGTVPTFYFKRAIAELYDSSVKETITRNKKKNECRDLCKSTEYPRSFKLRV